jgi:hypothetical protein
MGWKHRLNRTYSVFVLGASVVASMAAANSGCSSDDTAHRAEARREILRGEDLDKEHNERMEKQRLTNYQGDLMPSDTLVAGVVIPRGFKPKFTFAYEWYYDGALPFAPLEKYFRATLQAESIDRPDSSSVQFSHARTKGVANMSPVTVKIFPVPGRSDWSRIYILAPQPLPEHLPTEQEIRAELAARKARAE